MSNLKLSRPSVIRSLKLSFSFFSPTLSLLENNVNFIFSSIMQIKWSNSRSSRLGVPICILAGTDQYKTVMKRNRICL